MIQNDTELKCSLERIAWFAGLVAQFRVSVSPAEFTLMAGGYLAEIEKMHHEVMEYLKRHANQPVPAEAA